MTEEFYNIKQYNRRWVNLSLFVIFAINNALHWTQFSTISDSIAAYYNVPREFIQWTSGLYPLSYVLFVAPSLYAMEKIKMRYVMIIASSLSTLGAWIKVFSVAPDRFLLAFFGQFIITVSYTFTFGGSARIIAAWFGIHESSRASALSLFGDQFGGAVSFLIPIIMVQESSETTIFESSLMRMHITIASFSTLFLTLIILVFKDRPKNPPSMVQALKKVAKKENFTQSVQKMMKNPAFLMLLFWYSVIGGLTNTLGAVLGELISINFPDSKADDAGKIGFIMSACGMFSSPIFGYVMDKTHRFREIGIVLATGSFISFSSFTVLLKMNNVLYVYASAVIVGAFTMSTCVNCIQIGIEILYPISEDQCCAMMVFLMQIAGTVSLPVYGAVLRNYSDIEANLIFCILTLAGSAISILTPIKLNRQEAENVSSGKELKEFLPHLK